MTVQAERRRVYSYAEAKPVIEGAKVNKKNPNRQAIRSFFVNIVKNDGYFKAVCTSKNLEQIAEFLNFYQSFVVYIIEML